MKGWGACGGLGRHRERWAGPVSLLLLGTLLLGFVPQASAVFEGPCGHITHGNWKYDFGLGVGTIGPALKDVKFGDEYRVKFANFRWINLDADADLVAMEWTTQSDCSLSFANGVGTAAITYSTTASSGNDGFPGATITVTVVDYAGGTLEVFITSSAGGSSRTVPFYVDVDINPSGSSADGGDDSLWFNSRSNNEGAPAEQHSEVQWVPGWTDKNDFTTYFAWEGAYPTSYSFGIGTEPYVSGTTISAYALKCTACSDSGSSQYTNGPWDYLGTDSTWGADVQVVLVHSMSGLGTGSVTTRFLFLTE